MVSQAVRATTLTSVRGSSARAGAPAMARVMSVAMIARRAAACGAGRVQPCRGARAVAGFTLLEMLVVLVIAGILISMATLTTTRNPRTALNEQAQRLALLFESAGDEAQVRSQPIAWVPVAGGYRFEARTADGWRALRDDLLASRRWDTEVTGVAIRYPGSDETVSRIVFGVESIDTPVEVTLYSAIGQVSIVGNGNGRFEVR
ncbi:GspH/FimT family pseudopilin [Mycetohabitans rhizoxinica]|uniref:GspH/FimT family pseudopilin n=1 Tax=Mycetohabitans rhizoxinica TaxID=412963 RepID=UPI0030D1886D